MRLVPAKAEDAGTLTQIAINAKRRWGYPERWIESWRDALTVQPDFICSHETYTAIVNEQIAGFYALGHKDDRLELLHMWVRPDAMRHGIGRSLFFHALERAKALGFRELEIESDPNAEGFYRRMGARRVGLRIRNVEQKRRELPIMVYEMDRVA
jgi:ribosomal protein S18 acetylase RimI-like enzyme